MNATHKTLILALTLLTGIAIIGGCSKVNNSVVGQWNLTYQEAIARTPSTTLWDSTLTYPIGSTFTLNSDGSYDLIVPSTTPEYGTWVQNGSNLTLTKAGGQVVFHYIIEAVSTHAMTLQRFDTTQTSPTLVVIDRHYNHTR